MRPEQLMLRKMPELADRTELEAALRGLDRTDLVRLGRIAKARSAVLADYDWNDLLNEAIARSLGGTRKWPRNVPLVAFLAQTMRSIASEGRRHSVGVLTSIDKLPGAVQVADEQPLADRATEAHEQVEAVLEEFARDEAVSILIDSLARDETPSQVRVRTGMDPKTFDAARKRLSRGVERMTKEGRL